MKLLLKNIFTRQSVTPAIYTFLLVLNISCDPYEPEPTPTCDYLVYDAKIVNDLEDDIHAELRVYENGETKLILTDYHTKTRSEPLPVDCTDYEYQFTSHNLTILINCCHDVVTIFN